MTYHMAWLVTRLIRRVSLVEQELPTRPEHLISLPILGGVRVTRSLILYICFVDRCLSFSTFSFGHCVVCSSSIYGFWLHLWYLQTLLSCGFLCKIYYLFFFVHHSIVMVNFTYILLYYMFSLIFVLWYALWLYVEGIYNVVITCTQSHSWY